MVQTDQNTWLTWRAARHDELAGVDSWLGLIGLEWLQEGRNRDGSGGDCIVCLPRGPAYLGDLLCSGESVAWQPLGAEALALATDREGAPTVIEAHPFAFFVVERDGRLAARVRDRDWAKARPFDGVCCFSYDAAWDIDANWVTLEPPVAMTVPNVSGELKPVLLTHKAVFDVAGQTVELLPMSVSESEAFFVFRDRTSGRESYGAGRFLKVPLTGKSKIRLNFNFAYNPPCAFTAFATCPLPPPENWLGFAIPAGELKPAAKA